MRSPLRSRRGGFCPRGGFIPHFFESFWLGFLDIVGTEELACGLVHHRGSSVPSMPRRGCQRGWCSVTFNLREPHFGVASLRLGWHCLVPRIARPAGRGLTFIRVRGGCRVLGVANTCQRFPHINTHVWVRARKLWAAPSPRNSFGPSLVTDFFDWLFYQIFWTLNWNYNNCNLK